MKQQTSRARLGFLMVGLIGLLVLTCPGYADDPPKKQDVPKYPGSSNETKKTSIIPLEWHSMPKVRLKSADVDQLLGKEQRADQVKTAPLTTDEQFVRRVYLDLTGKLPTPQVVQSFVANKDSFKRRELIDRLLNSDEFNNHWARYWREVVASRATEQRIRVHDRQFEQWLHDQIKANTNWATMAREMITAKGMLTFDLPFLNSADSKKQDDNFNPAVYFLLTSRGAEAVNERAAETARIFLGIQIQCAQCHDHPSDIWKQHQFHEFAAFFARTRDRLVRVENPNSSSTNRNPMFRGQELVSLPRGEHQMTDTKDPNKKTTLPPKYLSGEGLRMGSSDQDRRNKLADFITSKDNYWFAAAFVNRLWGELMGQAFYQPVDNMGPLQEAMYPQVLLHLAAHFTATDYDIRDLYRVLLNTETYQRQIRIGDAADKHLQFAGSYPARLRADTLWESLESVLGSLNNFQPPRNRPGVNMPAPPPNRPGARRFGLENLFVQTFAMDPSARADSVEGTVPQALMLMNNPVIQNKIRAVGDNTLAKILREYQRDEEAIKALYVKTLARKPTNREARVALDYVKSQRNRNEAYEDLMWALLNSAEFQTKR